MEQESGYEFKASLVYRKYHPNQGKTERLFVDDSGGGNIISSFTIIVLTLFSHRRL